MTDGHVLGRAFVESLVERDLTRTASLFHPDLSFRGLTPGRFWQAEPPIIESAISILEKWFFEDDDGLSDILRFHVERVGPDRLGDRFKLSYSFEAKSPVMSEYFGRWDLERPPPDADWVVEQEAYYDVKDDKIVWMIVLCGGYHPLAARRETVAG